MTIMKLAKRQSHGSNRADFPSHCHRLLLLGIVRAILHRERLSRLMMDRRESVPARNQFSVPSAR
jgi:hypothetical protein